MYTIIYWKDDDILFPCMNLNGTLRLFSTLQEADTHADKIEEDSLNSWQCRVISIDQIHE